MPADTHLHSQAFIESQVVVVLKLLLQCTLYILFNQQIARTHNQQLNLSMKGRHTNVRH